MRCGFGNFGDDEDKAVHQRVHDSLKSGSKLLFELINRNWMMHDFGKKSTDSVNGIKLVEAQEHDEKAKRVNSAIRRYFPDDIGIKKRSWHSYNPREIKQALRRWDLDILSATAR
jgi:hypothetical protein